MRPRAGARPCSIHALEPLPRTHSDDASEEDDILLCTPHPLPCGRASVCPCSGGRALHCNASQACWRVGCGCPHHPGRRHKVDVVLDTFALNVRHPPKERFHEVQREESERARGCHYPRRTWHRPCLLFR